MSESEISRLANLTVVRTISVPSVSNNNRTLYAEQFGRFYTMDSQPLQGVVAVYYTADHLNKHSRVRCALLSPSFKWEEIASYGPDNMRLTAGILHLVKTNPKQIADELLEAKLIEKIPENLNEVAGDLFYRSLDHSLKIAEDIVADRPEYYEEFLASDFTDGWALLTKMFS